MSERKKSDAAHGREVIYLDRRTLLAQHLAGDKEAFGEFMKLYRAPVYTYLVRCGVEQASRDDLFQEIFIKIHLAAQSYDVKRALSPWVFTIVANTVRSFYRKRKIEKLVLGEESIEQSDSMRDAHAVSEARETAGWVGEAVAKLPFAQREALVLSTVSELNQKQIAEILKLPIATLKTHLHRARTAIAEALSRKKATITREVSQ